MEWTGVESSRLALMHAWQLTALIAVVLVASRYLARNKPHLAYMLWLVVLVKCVTPPIWSSPASAFSWLETATRPATSARMMRMAPGETWLAGRAGGNSINAYGTDEHALSANDIARLAAYRAGRLSGRKTTTGFLTFKWLGWIWIVGSVTTVLVSVIRWTWCAGQLRRAGSIEIPGLESKLQELAQRLCVRRRVRLSVTAGRVGPAVIGLWHPVVVLPEIVVRGNDPATLQAILAHELIHVRRGDLWLGVLQLCARAVWWFHPLVFWATRNATREAERCCDEEVIGELGCDPRDYARSLLDILELKRTLQPVPAFPGMKPVEVTSQRLERIMKLGQGCRRRTPNWCWGVMLLLLTLMLPGAAFRAAEDPDGDATLTPSPAPLRPAGPQDDAGPADGGKAGDEKASGTVILGASVSSDLGVKGALTLRDDQFSQGSKLNDASKAIRAKLATKGEFHFVDRPFSEVVERLESVAGLKLNLFTDALGREGLVQQSDVTLDVAAPISVGEALDQLLAPHRLHHVVRDGQVMIALREEDPLYTQVYNVQKLLGCDLKRLLPPEIDVPAIASDALRNLEILVTLVKQNIAAESWEDAGGEGAIESFATNQSLVVAQSAHVHQRLTAYLRGLQKEFGLAVAPRQFQHVKPAIVAGPRRYVTRVYSVADLVIPIPNSPGTIGPKNAWYAPGPVTVDFDTLIDLITSTIVPDDWSGVDGAGHIAAAPSYLSLVVRQTDEVQKQISDLIEQLRRLQDVQITIETRFMQVPAEVLRQWRLRDDGRGPAAESVASFEKDGHGTLSHDAATSLVEDAIRAKRTDAFSGPKITLFDGQAATMQYSGEGGAKGPTCHYQAVASSDHRNVRLSWGIGDDAATTMPLTKTVQNGESLLLDVSHDATCAAVWPQNDGMAFLRDFPYVGTLFGDARQRTDDRLLLLVTPRILFRGEFVMPEEEGVPAPLKPADVR